MKHILFTFVLLLSGFPAAHSQTTIELPVDQPEELTANAGNDASISSGTSVNLGDVLVATGGTEPYSYVWNDGIEAISSEANPAVNPTETTMYTLFVMDNTSCTATDNITITIMPVGISDFHEKALKIYPNPVNDRITIDYMGGECRVSLLTEQGKELWNKPLCKKTSFAVPGIPGIYLLKIVDKDKVRVRKIIVSR